MSDGAHRRSLRLRRVSPPVRRRVCAGPAAYITSGEDDITTGDFMLCKKLERLEKSLGCHRDNLLND